MSYLPYKMPRPTMEGAVSNSKCGIDRSGCAFAGPGRGDCAHFIGVPGKSIPGQHDGPDTEDHYGKPNGWCWSCWKDHRLNKLEARIAVLTACLKAIDNEFVDPLEPWGPDLELPRDWLLGVREVLRVCEPPDKR